jgi:transcriptional regulator with GAF, ATPase, and Fis domain
MRLEEWIESRQTPGTVADLARRLLADGTFGYAILERDFRESLILEALVLNKGNQEAAARAIGVHPQTVSRVMDTFEVSVRRIRRLAQSLRGAQ